MGTGMCVLLLRLLCAQHVHKSLAVMDLDVTVLTEPDNAPDSSGNSHHLRRWQVQLKEAVVPEVNWSLATQIASRLGQPELERQLPLGRSQICGL